MTIPFFMWCLFGWIVSGTIAAVMSLAFEGQVSVVNDFLQFEVFTMKSVGLGSARMSAPLPNFGWILSLASVATYDYEFLKGNLNLFRWFLFLVLGGGFSFGLIREFGPLMISAIGALAQGVGSVFGGLLRKFI